MHIFIDESGPFIVSEKSQREVSCVGALIIPDCKISDVFGQFETLRKKWPNQNGETKGKLLQEDEISKLIRFLSKYDVIFVATCIDMGMQNIDVIEHHKKEQAERFTLHLTSECHENLVKQIWELRMTLESMTNQLYIQSLATITLVLDVFELSTFYYCQRRPKELEGFHWAVDAKDSNITKYEDWWQSVMLPFLQDESAKKPFPHFEKGCYKYFERFFLTLDNTPKHLIPLFGNKEPFYGIDINKIMQEDFVFQDSKESIGLQLVDVLVNTLRRALKGNLQEAGWGDIGRLMICKPRKTIHFITIDTNHPRVIRKYSKTFSTIERKARKMMLDVYYKH